MENCEMVRGKVYEIMVRTIDGQGETYGVVTEDTLKETKTDKGLTVFQEQEVTNIELLNEIASAQGTWFTGIIQINNTYYQFDENEGEYVAMF